MRARLCSGPEVPGAILRRDRPVQSSSTRFSTPLSTRLAKSPAMDHLENCELLEGEIERFASLVESTTPSISVPSCPGWTVGDLVVHLGSVHRWAEYLVKLRAPSRMAPLESATDYAPGGDWIRRGGASLLSTLRTAEPTTAMWAWGRDQHVRFWSRRQLHETLIHRFDLELAKAEPPSAPGHVVVDTIDEFLDNLDAAAYFSPKVARLRGEGETIVFRALDTGHSWTVTLRPDRFEVEPDEQPANASLSGPALELSLVMYRRKALAGSELEVEGSADLVAFWLANSALE